MLISSKRSEKVDFEDKSLWTSKKSVRWRKPLCFYVCFYHITYAFQSESTLYICLNVKGLLARNMRDIWSLSDCSGTRTHKHLVRKRTLNHLAEFGRKKKARIFCTVYFSERNFFNICVLFHCLVYWIHFQNIHTFTCQKRLLHTLLLLVFKILESLQCILNEHRFRHNFKECMNLACSCILEIEDTSHYLLHWMILPSIVLIFVSQC